MDNQPRQRFCTNCGQPLTPGTALCAACGTPVSAPSGSNAGQSPAAAQPGYAPSSMQSPAQVQDDLLLAGLAAGSASSQARRNRQRQARRPGSRLRGCGCFLLVLAVLAGPFIGFVLTTGRLHVIFAYVAGGLVAFFFLLVLIGMLMTRRGREVLAEGCAEGCLDAIFGGLLGGG
jgi:hypothetical protein